MNYAHPESLTGKVSRRGQGLARIVGFTGLLLALLCQGRPCSAAPTATRAYSLARLTLCAEAGASAETLGTRLREAGFQRSGGDWRVADADGETVVRIVDGREWLAIISYFPSAPGAIPESVLSTLRQKAKAVKFQPPGEVLLEFDEQSGVFSGAGAPLCSEADYLTLRIADGFWVQSNTFVHRPRR